jgi:aryl-alcohol dehydrogenase-like predicted oxidoreductase
MTLRQDAFDEPTSKLALGTVQFGQRYGVANAAERVTPQTVAAILDLAGSEGIDTLDTAAAYGNSESCLGDVGVSSWRVITKLPALPDDTSDVASWVELQVRGSMQRLRIARLEGLLLHRPADLLGPHGARLLTALAVLKSRDWIGAAGISIYDPGELDMLWPLWQPEILQAPCSVLDRRLVQSGWLPRLKRQGTRLHLRSVFLQGLLLMPSRQRPAFFARWRGLLDRWLDWCAAHSVSPLRAALGYACALPDAERVVVGVDSIAQLQEILDAARAPAPTPPADLFSDERELLEPSRWMVA